MVEARGEKSDSWEISESWDDDDDDDDDVESEAT